MLSLFKTTRRRSATRSSKSKRASQKPHVERLEDRRLLAASAMFMGLGDLPGGDYNSTALGVSDDGQTVVGRSVGSTGASEPFKWNVSEGMTALPLLAGEGSHGARAASADGSVIVGQAGFESVLWENGSVATIASPPSSAAFSGAYDISDDGLVVVGANDNGAYRWEGGATVGLGNLGSTSHPSTAIAVSGDGSYVVGWGLNVNDQYEPFRWREDIGLMSLGFNGRARDVSADGSIVAGFAYEVVEGKGNKTSTITEAFRWTEASKQLLGDLPGGNYYSAAYAMSADGSIVAGTSQSSSGGEAFVWESATGMRSLNEILANDYGVDLAGWQLGNVWDVTPDGSTLVGQGTNPNGFQEAFLVRFGPPAPGVSVSPSTGLMTSEAGGTASFDVVLTTQPVAEVIIALSSSDETEGTVAPAQLIFTAANWDVPQTVTVTGQDDLDDDGDIGYSIVTGLASSTDPDYNGLSVSDVSVTNIDDEGPAAEALYVYDIRFESRGRGNDWRAVFEIRSDSDPSGTAADEVRSGVKITVVFAGQEFSGTTDADGIFRTGWIQKLSSGSHYAEAVDLALTGYAWNKLLDLEDDSDGDGLPDAILNV